MKHLLKYFFSILLISFICPLCVFAKNSDIITDSSAAETISPVEETEILNNIAETEDVKSTDIPDSQSPSVDETISSVQPSDLTRDFVKRLYETLLLRSPDTQGLDDWTNQLKSGSKTGADIICGFIFSDEFTNNNYPDNQYVELLYRALFDRYPDSTGFDGWMKDLYDGLSRTYVAAGFINSEEFHNLCSRFEINPGVLTPTSITDTNPDITRFVSYLYQFILSRKCDKAGLTDWVTQLSSHQSTAAHVVAGFIFSEEFENKDLSNQDFVTILYKTILGRTPDTSGLNDWCSALEYGMSRNYVLKGFIESTEFSKLCDKYGIISGSITLSEARDQNRQTTKYVYICFQNCLSRNASINELNTWTARLNNRTTSPGSFLQTLLFSPESYPAGLTDAQYIKRLYMTLYHRAPSEAEISSLTDQLTSETRKQLFINLLVTEEYETLLNIYGLTARTYQNPSQYYQILDYIAPLTGGGYDLSKGYEGLKVAKVIEKLGVNNGKYIGMTTKAEYTSRVVTAVKEYQTKHDLPVTGIVNLETWLHMGFSEYDWYHLGAYVTPLKTNSTCNRKDHIEAMIATAYEYLNTPYVVGASGKPGEGVDCSGLTMQALYSAGIDMSPITPVRHSHPGYEYESANMWKSSQFKKVTYAQRQRGDLIIYQNSKGIVIHVAIYLGDDQVIESMVPINKVSIAPIKDIYRSNVKGVLRPFV